MIDFRKLIIITLSLLGFWVVFELTRAFAPSWLFWTLSIVASMAGLLYIAYKPKEKPKERYYLLTLARKYDTKGIRMSLAIIRCYGPLNIPKTVIDSIGNVVGISCVEIDRETFRNLDNSPSFSNN